MQTLTVKLPEPMMQALEALAREEERSKGYYVRKALTRLLEDMEDIRIAEERLRDGEPGIPFEEVMRRNGLED